MGIHAIVTSKEQAIEVAYEYAASNDLGDSLSVHEAFYRTAMSEHQRIAKQAALGREMDADEIELFRFHNGSGWVVQLVSDPCGEGETPQGPKTLIDDTGDTKHFVPM